MLTQNEAFQNECAVRITDHGLHNLAAAIIRGAIEDGKQVSKLSRFSRLPDGEKVGIVYISLHNFLYARPQWAQTLCDFENVDFDKLKRICEVE